MFTPEEYFKAWLMYLGGVVLMMGCWWYLTHFIRWREVRQLARVIVGVLLCVPWYTDTTGGYMAPAFIIAIVDSLTIDSQAFWRAGTPLLIALIGAIVISLGWHLWRWHRESKAQNEFRTEPHIENLPEPEEYR